MCNYEFTAGSKIRIMPADLCFVYGQYLEDYLRDVEICQRFARRSREFMAEIILERTGLNGTDGFHTVHNYIDTDEMILRKPFPYLGETCYFASLNIMVEEIQK